MPTAAISATETAAATRLTHLGSFLSGFMPGFLASCGLLLEAARGWALLFPLCVISDLGLGSLQSGQRCASDGTSTWHLGHFINYPHGAIWSTLAVHGPIVPRYLADLIGEDTHDF